MPSGRRTSLTPEVHKTIVAAVRRGNFRGTAAAAAGVHRSSLFNWEKRGEAGEEPYASFMADLQQAEAKAEMNLLRKIRQARPGVDVWQTSAWLLERRWPSRWCARIKQQVAENVDALLTKLKAHPELHKQVHDVLAAEEDPTPSPTAH